jgi:hypothetical protein
MRLACFLVIILFFGEKSFAQGDKSTWQDCQKNKSCTLTVYWFPNSPFGFEDSDGHIKGVEAELVESFATYIKTHYQTQISIQWIKQETFNEVLNRMKNPPHPGTFGVAGFSLSEERKKFMKFSPSYMADIAVLVSTPDIPTIHTTEDFQKYLNGTTALTAKGTVLEIELKKLRDDNQLNFTIEYTGASKELIDVLNVRKKSFGYLSLPIYLSSLDKGISKLRRQNYLTKRFEGRGIGMPKSSDWDGPMKEYFESPEFRQDFESIISRHVNLDLYNFIETFNPANEISLLNKEKDIQQMKLKVQELTIQEKNQKQTFLIIITSAITVSLLVIAILYRKLVQSNHLLSEQKSEIEAQSDQIMQINDNLETTIRERTRELENKNKALEEYAFITAHKLRAPLASILGLVALISKFPLRDGDKEIVEHLDQSAKKLDKVIHSVMNAIDGTSDSDNNNSHAA